MTGFTRLKAVVPEPTAIIREGIIVLGGILLAAYFLSKFPKLKKFVKDQSITVNDGNGNPML